MRKRGFTLLELLVTVAITAVLMVLIVSTSVSFDHAATRRQKVNFVQREARDGLSWLQLRMRSAASGVSLGSIQCNLATAGTGIRPAIEVYKNAGGSGLIDIKPNTDALLIVSGQAPHVPTIGTPYNSNVSFQVTDNTGGTGVTTTNIFPAGAPVLVSDYKNAAWGIVNTSSGSLPATINLVTGSTNLFPQFNGPAVVSAATSLLYYVDTADQLAVLTLTTPRLPGAGENYTKEILGNGYENLQLDALMDPGTGGAWTTRPTTPGLPVTGGLQASDPISSEAQTALGPGSNASVPLFSVADQAYIREIQVSVSIRSVNPNADLAAGDPEQTLDGQTPPPCCGQPAVQNCAAPCGGNYVRRVFTVPISSRDTSLEVL
jgi:prepilin-type N-terminal cleavage/methylation domain-containing protein